MAVSSFTAFGQSAFEVASIKPSKAGVGISLLTDPSGRFTAEHATFRMLVTFAYGVRDFQVSGGPGWIDSDQFDVTAKPAVKSNRAQTLQMLQTLLADRFQLKFHRDTKEQPILALTVAKSGPKFKESKPDDPRATKGLQGGRGELTGAEADMGALARRLSTHLGRAVIDKTGLTGRYDFKLKWTPDTGPRAIEDGGPSLSSALQEQLGLKLEAQKGPVEILVIDHVAKPSSN